MKAGVTDPVVLGAVRPLDVSAYLRARGWRLLAPQSDGDVGEWEKDTAEGRVEVVVPRHARWRDYPRRVREIVAILSQDEGRSELQVVHDIALASRDIVRLRAIVDGRSDGTIPLADGAQLANVARRLMLAAACSTHDARRAYHSRKPPPAVEYLNELSLGQTEIGSFVMTVISPVPPGLAQTVMPFDGGAPMETNFNRRVTQMLATGLAAVRSAAENGVATGDLASFEGAVDLGVSADLCEALALVHECHSVSALDVNIGWAPSRPAGSGFVTRHEFARDTLEVIREAGRALRENSPVDDFEVNGVVVSLDRPEEPLQGIAVVRASVDSQVNKKIRIALTGADWQKAISALHGRLAFRCQGELVREGRLHVLRHARDVRVGQGDED